MASQSMPFTSWRKRCGSRGWLSTWMPCWLRHLPPAPTAPSTASVWERRAVCASRAGGEDFPASRTNATIPGCASCCRSQQEGNQGIVLWKGDALGALIDWNDPVVKHGLAHRIKYARLIRRRASSQRAAGADSQGNRYSVQLALEGLPYHKPKHLVGSDTIGLDLGPSSVAVVPREGEASLSVFCEALRPDVKAIRRLQRKMDRQRRVANPEHYDAQGRIKKRGKQKLVWKSSRSYQKTRQRKAARERKLAAHRQSLHGRHVHEIVAVGNTILLEKLSYKAWQKRYGRSVGAAGPRDVCRQTQTHRCKHGRHPDRSSHTQHPALPMVSWLRQGGEKAALSALAHLSLWSRAGAARPVLCLSGCLS